MNIAKTIEIISIPHGDAPTSVRLAWVGCRLPTASAECGHVPQYVESVLPPTRQGLLTTEEFLALPPTEKIAGYNVDQAVALAVLEKHAPWAVAWWRENGFPQKDKTFCFKREECATVDTYTDEELRKFGPIVRCDDMETGTMRPME